MSLRDVLPRAMARHNGKLRHFTASAANLPQQGDLPFSIEELHAQDLQIETTVIITTVSICEYDAKSPLPKSTRTHHLATGQSTKRYSFQLKTARASMWQRQTEPQVIDNSKSLLFLRSGRDLLFLTGNRGRNKDYGTAVANRTGNAERTFLKVLTL